MEVYASVGDCGGGERRSDAGADGGDIGGGYADGGEAGGEAVEVLFECEDFAVIASEDLVDAVAEEDSAVEAGWVEVVEGQEAVLYHCHLHRVTHEKRLREGIVNGDWAAG